MEQLNKYKYPEIILVKNYFDIHNYYSEIYGINRTIILMQVGSFHEAYCTDTDGINLMKLAQQLDVTCTMKNNKIPLSKSNPRMLGFPIYVTFNFIDKLIDLNYTVILIDQVSDPPNPKRDVTGIYSPATHINKQNFKTLYLVSIVLEKIKDKLCIGLSAYDLSTGEGSVYETYSKPNDILIALDDTLRFLDKYPPNEVILLNNINENEIIVNMKINEIINYLNIDMKNIYTIKIKEHTKIIWQRKLLTEVYKLESNIDIIERLHLEFINWARLSLVILLDYVISHQVNLVNNLKEPKIFDNDCYLYLGNRALEQLNINSNLLNIINYTKTPIGKKYLNNQLKFPLINTTEINLRYNIIKNLIENNHYSKIINYLEDIYDLDKIIRKIEMNILNPYELYNLYLSVYQINKLFEYCHNNNLLELLDINNKLIKNVKKIIIWIEDTFILEKINNLNFNNFTECDFNFYNKNYNENLDSLQDNINICQNFMIYLVKELEKLINDKKNENLITIKNNDRDGYYLLITNKRCLILKKNFKDLIKINNIEISINDLEFTELPKSPSTKITCKKIKEISSELINYKFILAKQLKESFKNNILEFKDKFNSNLYKCSNKIAFIDFINSGAICAINNHYSMPIIELSEYSFINATELRHPIVEKIKTDTSYIPHNIQLGCNMEQDGILLYGINSSGKSTLMKSIAVNIILAQIGYYVAASNFIYNPYKALFTRIGNNDNMFRGQSSFMVEMMELMSILKRNDNKTLIVADEIASGSEIKSGIIIICYMLEVLSAAKSSFITATHLHDISNMECVKKINNIKIKHLKLTYDSVNDILIYDRNLLNGQGDTFYGLQIAKYLMKNNNFNERTLEILKEYENNDSCDKKSKYNSKIYMNKCEICNCKDKLETHHIVWQKDFNPINGINLNKFYLQKNNESNLVTLCTLCHDKVDSNEIIIDGWNETSEGRKLKYELNTHIKKKKKKKDKKLKK